MPNNDNPLADHTRETVEWLIRDLETTFLDDVLSASTRVSAPMALSHEVFDAAIQLFGE